MQRVNPNCTALEQKQFQEKQDIDININDIRESYLRCGEIYMNGTENFKFVCILCEKSFFTNIEEFVVHVTNCELTTENLKLDAVEIVNIEQVTLKEELIDSPDMETENSELEDPVEEFLSYNESEDCEPNNIEPKTLETNNSTSDKTVKTFACDYCNRKYCSNDSLKRHLKQTHSGSVMKKICEKSKNKPSLKREEFLCEYCDKKYIHQRSLRRHLKKRHPVTANKQYNYLSCDFPNCNCKFKSKESLEIHINYDHKAIDVLISNSKQHNKELKQIENDFSEKGNSNLNQNAKVDDHKNLKFDAVEVLSVEQISLKEELIDSLDMETEKNVLKNPVKEFGSSYNESEGSELNDNELKTIETNNSASDKTVKTFSCDYCNRKYCSNGSLTRHLKKSHSNPSLKREKFLCDYCDKKYSQKESLKNHWKKEHPGTVYKEKNNLSCSFPNCKCKFRSKESLEIHINYDHKAIDMFISNSKLQVEDLEKDENDFSEKDSTNLNQSAKVDDLNCRFCERCFLIPIDRYIHERIHAGIKPYKCRFCDKFSRTKKMRNVHELTHQATKRYKCHLCDFAFFQKTNLKTHIKRHLGQKDLPCKFCGKLFFSNSERDIHESTHVGKKTFQCSECGNCYFSLSRLNVHVKRKHSSNVKRFKCGHCGKVFSTKNSLKNHNLTHTGEKLFACEMCNSKFSTKVILRQHMKIHSNVAEYTCKICGKGFKQKPGLYCHTKVHGEVLS